MPTKEETEAGVQRSAEYWGWKEVQNPDIIQPLMDIDCLNGHKMIKMDQIPKPFPIQPTRGRFIGYPLPVPEKPETPSGLIIVESEAEKAFRASDARVLVVAVGEPQENVIMPEVGQVVIVSKGGGQPTFAKGSMYIIFHAQMDFIATVTGPTDMTEDEIKRSEKVVIPERSALLQDEASPPSDIIVPPSTGGDA